MRGEPRLLGVGVEKGEGSRALGPVRGDAPGICHSCCCSAAIQGPQATALALGPLVMRRSLRI